MADQDTPRSTPSLVLTAAVRLPQKWGDDEIGEIEKALNKAGYGNEPHILRMYQSGTALTISMTGDGLPEVLKRGVVDVLELLTLVYPDLKVNPNMVDVDSLS